VKIVRGKEPYEQWTGPTYETCRTAGKVAKAWRLGNRFPNLSFRHHLLVTGIKDTGKR
jgi:hypothetical protein